MKNIVLFQIKKQYKSVLVYLAALVGFAWMYISLFPSMQKIDIEAMMSQLPKEFLGFLGEGGGSAYNTIEGFLSVEFFSFFFVLLIGFYVSSVAGAAIAGGIERRTMDFELSQPVSRTKKLLSETFVAIIFSILIVTAANLMIKLLCVIYNIDISSKGLFYFSILASLFSMAIYGIAIFLSSIVRSKMSVVGITLFFTLGSYVFYSLSLAVEKIKDFGKFTLYYLYDPQKTLSRAELNLDHCLILLFIFILGTITALIIFNKKDV
ncbi:MAG: ABC transporter permease subunit [Candidatus Berkelbacteria bacterium]